jgi:hypothetical protein
VDKFLVLLLLLAHLASGASLDFISVPDSVQTGEEFTIIINITSDEPLEIYSYVYSGKKCYSFGGWKFNTRVCESCNGLMNFTNSVKHDAESGNYTLKVRARGEKDWDLTYILKVDQKSVNLFKEVSSESKEDPVRTMLPMLILIPLGLLSIKTFLRF